MRRFAGFVYAEAARADYAARHSCAAAERALVAVWKARRTRVAAQRARLRCSTRSRRGAVRDPSQRCERAAQRAHRARCPACTTRARAGSGQGCGERTLDWASARMGTGTRASVAMFARALVPVGGCRAHGRGVRRGCEGRRRSRARCADGAMRRGRGARMKAGRGAAQEGPAHRPQGGRGAGRARGGNGIDRLRCPGSAARANRWTHGTAQRGPTLSAPSRARPKAKTAMRRGAAAQALEGAPFTAGSMRSPACSSAPRS